MHKCKPATGCVRFSAVAIAMAAALDIEENGVGPNVLGMTGTACATGRLMTALRSNMSVVSPWNVRRY